MSRNVIIKLIIQAGGITSLDLLIKSTLQILSRYKIIKYVRLSLREDIVS